MDSELDMFERWFRNRASESLQLRIRELSKKHPDLTEEFLVLELLDDVVDVWLEAE